MKFALFALVSSLLSVATVSAGVPCNSVITTVTQDEIKALAEVAVDGFLQPAAADRQAILDAYTATVQYDVVVSKACSSCAAVRSVFPDADVPQCAEGAYGAAEEQSTLVVHPLDPATGAPLAGQCAGAMHFAGTRLAPELAPSEFPANTSAFLDGLARGDLLVYPDYNFAYNDAIYSLIAASSGLIAIQPDYMGTGASLDTLDRTYQIAYGHRQMAAIGLVAAIIYTESVTNGCTQLDVVDQPLLASGYSAGGVGVYDGSFALRALGIELAASMVYSAVTEVTLLFSGFVGALFSQPDVPFDSAEFPGFVSFYLAAYSNDVPFLPNAGTNQTFMNPAWPNVTDVNRWFFEDKLSWPELEEVMFRNQKEFVGSILPEFEAAVFAAGPTGNACLDPPDNIALLCALLLENSILYTLGAVDFPLHQCYSPDDTIVNPIFSQLVQQFKNDTIIYNPDENYLKPKGSHAAASHYCAISISSFLLDNPAMLEVSPIVDSMDGSVCQETGAPTSSPVAETSATVEWKTSAIVLVVVGFMSLAAW